jgi:hypothetical protein
MHEFLLAFGNHDYGDLCVEVSEIRKNKDKSVQDCVIRFTHLCYRFPSNLNHVVMFLYMMVWI